MSILNTSINKKIKELGGNTPDMGESLESVFGQISLPNLFTDETLFEDFDYYCHGKKRAALKKVLESKNIDYIDQLLPIMESIFKVFYYRSKCSGDDLMKWSLGQSQEKKLLSITEASDLRFVEIGFWDGCYPDLFNVFLSDSNPSNPTVYATDHETSWEDGSVSNEGSLEDFLEKFLTPTQVINGLRERVL